MCSFVHTPHVSAVGLHFLWTLSFCSATIFFMCCKFIGLWIDDMNITVHLCLHFTCTSSYDSTDRSYSSVFDLSLVLHLCAIIVILLFVSLLQFCMVITISSSKCSLQICLWQKLIYGFCYVELLWFCLHGRLAEFSESFYRGQRININIS
jgi:hypothetical protein